MLVTVNLFLIAVLSFVLYQDFKQRQILWILLPLLLSGFIIRAFVLHQTAGLWSNSVFNLLFIFLQLTGISIYMSIKNKKLTNIINTYLGIGDILFFVVIAFAFSPILFIAFYVSALTLTAIGFMTYRLINKRGNPQIPLAGAMAGMLGLLILVSMFGPSLDFHADVFFINQLLS